MREDAFELYGFATEAEERLFRLLIKVPRVGAKMALNLIGSLGAGPAARSIADGDDKALAKVKGVGVKLAQTLVASATIPPTSFSSSTPATRYPPSPGTRPLTSTTSPEPSSRSATPSTTPSVPPRTPAPPCRTATTTAASCASPSQP